MLIVKTTEHQLHLFLILTGVAFERSQYDPNRSHSFYWAMRWLARQVLGTSWVLWLQQVGGE